MTSQKFPGIEADGTVSASTTAGAIRTNLGLGTAAVANTGTTNGTVPLLDATGLPAVNGSQLTNVTGITAAGAVAASTDAATIRGNLAVGMVDGGAGEITTPAALPKKYGVMGVDSDGSAIFIRRNVRNLSEWGVSEASVDNGAKINSAILEWYQAADPAVGGGAAEDLWDFELNPGQYYIEEPIVFGYQKSGVWQFGYNAPALRSAAKNKNVTQGGPPFSCARLIAQFNDAPLISTQGSRGFVLENVQLTGQSTAIATATSQWTWNTFCGRSNLTPTWEGGVYGDYGTDDIGRWAPSVGVAIDPFGPGPDEGNASGPPTAARYAGVPSSYYSSAAAYSSVVTIKDCSIEMFEVGCAVGLGVQSNSDGIVIKGGGISNCTYGFSMCHGQTKNVYILNTTLAFVLVGVTTQTHGQGIGFAPREVIFGNSSDVGSLFFNISPIYGSVSLRNSHIESVGQIYGSPSSSSEGAVYGFISPLSVDLVSLSLISLPLIPEFTHTIRTHRPVLVESCLFSQIAGSRIRLRNEAVVDPPATDATVDNNTGGSRHVYRNCVFEGQSVPAYGHENLLEVSARTAARRDYIEFQNCPVLGDSSGTYLLNGLAGQLQVGDWRGAAFDCKNGGTGGHFYTTTNLQDANVNEPWTIAVWLRPDTLSGDNYFIGGLTSHCIGISSNAVTVFYGGSDSTEPGLNAVGYGNIPLSAGSWQHFLFSWDGTDLYFYHNGIAYLPTNPASGNNTLDAAVLWNIDLYFGVSAAVGFQAFDGLARNCIIWKGTDEKANVNAIMAGTYTTGAAIIWEMDDTTGTQVTDTSGNANHGTSNTDLSVAGSMYAVDKSTHFPEGRSEYSNRLVVRSILSDDADLAAGQSITEADSSGNILSKINIGGTVYKTTLHQVSIPTYTITSGVIAISPFDKLIKVETESAAASDDLDTISGGQIGQEITVIAATAAQDTVLKDGVDNLDLTEDITVTSNTPVKLINVDGTDWVQVK